MGGIADGEDQRTSELQAVEQIDSRGLRTAFGCFPTGVTAVCALGERGPDGMAASAFTSVSLDPPLVSVCVQKSSTTWPRLRRSGRLGVTVLGADQGSACLSLSRKTGDRFAGVEWVADPAGAVFVPGAAAWLDSVVDRELEAGDHLIVLLRILRLRSDPAVSPLVFHGSRFRGVGAPVEFRAIP
ncbi:flavin reductase (DIM6/NTAB) family NADH-FMN oxidoreductase RutF [Pseudonocardia kunmingensis]|uniref:Flavin reductase (DIM6/NTAB) family NADH-FMN oxidoreductase RutF n=2 Tax=Pseudonocardia kunmingensis TaxID=630975 RepID=A0A543CY40_9PSEU|nr:flavin reductase family protein [Pseudonocardia kunmingensis]TQM01778.1 flavin reductase (DIM6/NTAB) family NADH-FMN oxidoreductase RutF [Pseudonocardia kunmingensis]